MKVWLPVLFLLAILIGWIASVYAFLTYPYDSIGFRVSALYLILVRFENRRK